MKSTAAATGDMSPEAREVDREQRVVKVAVRGIRKSFDDVVASDNVDLDIYEGEFLTLLGPSGCGKTTLMRVIAGLETPEGGTIAIGGRDVTDVRPNRRGVGMVFQQYSLFPHMTAAENVAYGLRVKKWTPSETVERVREMLELVRLVGVERRLPAQLSGGQQQRIALARALATSPSLLMLDEPLGALDLKLRRQMQLELKRIHRSTGVTFLYVTHDQDEALQMSDRIAIVQEGRLEQVADPRTIYENPATAFVADFVGDVTLLGCTATANPRVVEIDDVPDAAVTLSEATSERRFKLVVRPEHVRLPVDEDRPGSFAGRVCDVLFGGGATTYELRTTSGVDLRARAVGSPHPELALGRTVRMIIEGATVCLPA